MVFSGWSKVLRWCCMYGDSGVVPCWCFQIPTLSWVPMGMSVFPSPSLPGVHALAWANTSMEEVSTAVPYGKPSCG